MNTRRRFGGGATGNAQKGGTGGAVIDLFDVLARDHELVRALLRELEAGPPAGAGRRRLLPARKRQVDRLITEESGHEAVEGQYFWPEVRRVVPDGSDLADRGMAQERVARFLLDELLAFQPGEAAHEEMLAGFLNTAREHLKYEEHQVWPALRPRLSREEAADLGARIIRAKTWAPTRPHPRSSMRPALLRATAPLVGATDRFRDAVSGRHRH
ncbi:hemerythrin domain-containing protein [Sphaerisporangium sp. B11E5]|uniref:hemerythrin domain-containing protein n=1 Tax=Sphaerisporangium sp. B11E5 TaxID=3153563 RepID=UPI00325EBCAF